MIRCALSRLLLLLCLALLPACGEVGYCVQCAVGHLDVISKTRPIDKVLEDPSVPEAQRARLGRLLEIRAFAVDALGLPDNDSYRIYADIGRPYVVWNLVATPEFSLAPKQWCYPVVGCIAYRGYFKPERAQEAAEELAAKGYDIDVYGVKAYSTLSWFDDPVLNTFLDGSDSQLAGLVFHELAHQVVYVGDDCAFNESFAKTVESEGLRRWLQTQSDDAEWQRYLEMERLNRAFIATLQQSRDRLEELYARPLADEAMREEKQRILAALEDELRGRRDDWPDPAALDAWLERGLNNARLASIATYHEKVPPFLALLESVDGDLPAFYAEVGKLAQLPAGERSERLKKYGPFVPDPTCTNAFSRE